MIVHAHGRAIVGPGVDLREDTIAAEEVRSAVYEPMANGSQRITIECSDPGEIHQHVAIVRPDMAFRRRTALAAAARSRGLDAPQDEQLATIHEQLRDLDTPDPKRETESATRAATGSETEMTGPETKITGSEARHALDATHHEIERLRERSAVLRGRVQTREATGNDAGVAMASFRQAAGALADAETRRIAAKQRLERRREQLRAIHDRHERRLRLEDRVANLERAARRHLAAAIEARFADALAAVPGDEPATDDDTAPAMTAALATVRVASIHAPVVLDIPSIGWFRCVEAATDWLDAPVVWV